MKNFYDKNYMMRQYCTVEEQTKEAAMDAVIGSDAFIFFGTDIDRNHARVEYMRNMSTFEKIGFIEYVQVYLEDLKNEIINSISNAEQER